MNKRVYGIIGIKAINANWNADFGDYPKTLPNGDIFGSDKSLKYTMRRYWQDQGKPVFYMKSQTINKKKEISTRSLEERYNHVFDTDIKKEKDGDIIFKNLMSQTDIRQFGAAFAQQGANLSLTGVVQIGQGINKYLDAEPFDQDILSPFKNSNKEDSKQSSIGKMVLLDEGHYFYSFSINPKEYDGYLVIDDKPEIYDENDYEDFKNAAINSVTFYNSNSKKGCDNEFAMFVETKDNRYLPNLEQFIEFYKEDDNNIIEFTNADILESNNGIEIYVDPKITLKGFPKAKIFNIYTKEEI